MIPKKITLRNFLSYRQAELDFSGLHTACICGQNGAGKSSLLEAISWAVWGKTRATSDDDLIYLGEKSLRVDYEFIYNQQIYRIIRSRQKKKGGSLDFQILNNNGYKSISGKGIKDTQHKILECLNIDYETFINSAYLRQGRADEFMQNKPSERKKILANLLKLDQYDSLASEAKDLAKQFKFRSEEISRNLEEQQVKLDEKEAIVLELNNTNNELQYYQEIVKKTNFQLQEIQNLHANRKGWEDKLNWQKSNLQSIHNNIQQLAKEKIYLEQDIEKLNLILKQEDDINNNYNKLERLRREDHELNQKFNSYQELLTKKQQLEQQLNKTTNQLTLQIEREKANLDNLFKEEKELAKIVGNSRNLREDLETLHNYRKRLAQLDQLQLQTTPLLQQKQTIVTDLKAQESKLEAKLEQLVKEASYIEEKLAEVPTIRKKFFEVEEQLNKINISRNYQERIKEKGTQQKNLKQEYSTKKNCLIQDKEKLEIKLATLNQEHAICPLCEQHLDDNHLHHVINKTKSEREQIEADCWFFEEQIIMIDRRLEDLRQEYAQLSQKLAVEDSCKQIHIKLENQLDLSGNLYEQQEQIQSEKEILEDLLMNQKFGQNLRNQLEIIESKIVSLNYNEADHALLRKKESELRRIEYQQLKIQDSQKKLDKLSLRKPELKAKINQLEKQLEELSKNSELQQQINQLTAEMTQLNYDSQQHNNMRQTLQELQSYQLLYGDLQQAKKQHPLLLEKLNQIVVKLQTSQVEANKFEQDLDHINEQLSQLTDYSEELNKLEQESILSRQNINNLLTKKGRLEQNINNLEDRENSVTKLKTSLEDTKKKTRIYQELSTAFGKNGIQSLMIENILPQLEVEANHILSRLTGNQLHVQFLTQKPKANNTKSNAKFKDTLEIIIADANGTRSYETYSGGEAFRINFSIRLALSRILAQRSGTPLQLLIVDEGFGTQDAHGCERLIAALNAIASEFACILTVTHIAQFKEAFDTRIEVYKTQNGSQIRIYN